MDHVVDTVESLRARKKRPLHPGKTFRELGAIQQSQIRKLLRGPEPRLRPLRLDPHEEALRGGPVGRRGWWARLRAWGW
jgi:hypothetical protein